MRIRGRGSSVAIAGIATVLSLLVLELLLRLLLPQPLGTAWVSEDGLVLHVPNASIRYTRDEFSNLVVVNSMGLRDGEIAIPKPPGMRRVLVLGDSHVEGKQVAGDETFVERLEADLAREDPGGRWDVVNAGVSGYGTADELFFFRVHGRELDPDLVLIVFTLGNDLRDNERSRLVRWDGHRLQEISPVSPRGISKWWRRVEEIGASRSHLVQFMRDRLRELSRRPRESARPPNAGSPRPERIANTSWDLTEAILARLVEEIRAAGAEVLLVSMPSREAVRSATEERSEALRNRLVEFSRESNVPVVDLLPDLRAADRERRTHYDIDGHMNAVGHAVVARRLQDPIRDLMGGVDEAPRGFPSPRRGASPTTGASLESSPREPTRSASPPARDPSRDGSSSRGT